MEQNNQSTLHLLDTVTSIRKKYDEIAKITGENFNIFSVLHLESDEVRLHSRLIGELLNPNGSHNQKGLFLKMFIAVLNLEDNYNHEEIENAKVIVEENIGNISDDYTEGGRIDLVIKFNNKPEIVIENKIWAIDQPNQLARYNAKYPNAHLVYLTPYPKQPSNDSLGRLSIDKVKCITYQFEIKKWIELSSKEVYNFPLIREVLNHYLNLINKLTNQSRNKEMEKDLINKIISNEENLASAMLISGSINEIKSAIVIKFMHVLLYNLKLSITDIEGVPEKNNPFYYDFTFKNISNLVFEIDFNEGFGIYKKEPISQTEREIITSKLSFLTFKNESTEGNYHKYLWYTKNWIKIDNIKLHNDEFIKQQSDLILKIIEALKDVKI